MSFLAPPQRRPARRAQSYHAGPWVGMRDSLDPVVAVRDRARLLQNCYPLDPVLGSAVVGRPGFQQAGSQLGDTNKRTGQLVFEYTKRDGTTKTVAIVGGQGLYGFNWSTRAWSQVVTVANLTTNSITLSETARCYAVTFTDKMVVSDGVNAPWMWDGTSGAGGLTKLTNCPALYGQPVVYYAKLFGIKNSERSTLVWSEENDATTGYETGGYSNAWTLAQTNSEGFHALCATDEALYCLRARSVTKVIGAVTPDFQSSGTREGVSEDIGTASPASVVRTSNGNIYFTDSLGRPQAIVGGRILDPPLWADVRETVRAVDTSASALAVAQSWFAPETRTVGLGFAELGTTTCATSIQISPLTSAPVAVFRGYPFDRIATVYNASMRRVVMHLSSDGYAYDHGTEDGSLWDDGLNAGTAAITHRVVSMPLGFDAQQDKHWSRLDLSLRLASTMTLDVTYETPRGNNSAVSVSATAPGGYSLVGSAVVDTDRIAQGDWLELHRAVGWRGHGRWLSWTVQHATAGERFGLAMGTATAQLHGDLPGIS
jgi:hypothetical protein